ncbi:maleylacetoacetate isomerase [Plectosphaerella cucumerina]|uniref:Maleylacetoacetate isomerase n=1 Tax=Plectosphaerella cucumerina TaxID=40658 RepID=A0A8K0TDP5_9PEZI|nr:maleylacetoacetate isomerase [Plectosphaerella cucumerina]
MPEYTLYSYFRSSCSARVRIALNLKDIPYDLVPVNLLKSEQLSDAHRELNPSGSVPLLIAHSVADFKLGQSVAALEYIDEKHPGTASLLPPPTLPERRAVARSLALIVAADIQPVTNLRIVRRVKALGGDGEAWMRELMAEGLAAYEATAEAWAGKCSVGDDVTIADCCLLPAVWNAQRYGVDLEPYPTIRHVVEHLEGLPAVKKAGYMVQPDTPEELREKA